MASPAHRVILPASMPSSHASLSAVWFLYMAGLGLIFPFHALYLRENGGLGGTELGLVLAARPLMGMVGQPLWGQLADRTGSRTRVLGVIAVGAALAYAVFPLAQGFVPLLVAMAGVSVFATSFIPMTTSISLAALGSEASEGFGRVRVWGTVGFLCLVVAFPPLLHVLQRRLGWEPAPGGPSEPGLHVMFWVAAAFTLAAGALALRQPADGGLVVRAERGDLRALLRHRPFWRVLVFAFFAWLMLQGPILLFPVFVRESGGSLDTVSRMWVPMLALEIPLVLWSGAALRRLGPRGLVTLGVTADGLRWTLCALVPDLRVVFALMLLHGVVIAGMLVGLQLYVENVVPERLRSTGQGMLAMIGPSIGGILSSALAGLLFDHAGIRAPYLVGGSLALLLGASTTLLLPPPHRP